MRSRTKAALVLILIGLLLSVGFSAYKVYRNPKGYKVKIETITKPASKELKPLTVSSAN